MSVKEDPELRHIFAHFSYAFDYLGKAINEKDEEKRKDYVKAAEYELESVEGLFMWDEPDDDPDGPFIKTMREIRNEEMQRKTEEKL